MITAKIHKLSSIAQIIFYENYSSLITTLQTAYHYSFHFTYDDAVEWRCFINYSKKLSKPALPGFRYGS